jgi:hypothetical protein
MAQSTINYNDLFLPDFAGACLTSRKTIAVGQGELAAGTVMALNQSTNKFVKFDSDGIAPVLTVAAPVAQAPAVTTETVIKTQDPETTAVVVATVAAPVIAAPAVTTGSVNTTPTVGVCILLEAVDATDETTGLMGFQGQIDSDKIVLAGSTITTVTETVKAVLRANGIHVRGGTSALALAGV